MGEKQSKDWIKRDFSQVFGALLFLSFAMMTAEDIH